MVTQQIVKACVVVVHQWLALAEDKHSAVRQGHYKPYHNTLLSAYMPCGLALGYERVCIIG